MNHGAGTDLAGEQRTSQGGRGLRRRRIACDVGRALVVVGAALMVATGCAGPAAGSAPGPPAPGAPASLSTTDVNAWLDGVVPAGIERAGIAGAAVTVVHDGKVLTSGVARPVNR